MKIDEEALKIALNDPAFGENCWLTFYLAGESERHAHMRKELLELNATNLDGGEGGFVYGKVSVIKDETAIREQIAEVKRLSDASGVDVVAVDLDTSPDPEASKCYVLWNETYG